ncbi:MAG TPA: class I SAM-dependent methyltransferase [Mycobacteriales bacterium]|nr:class I SAM-dependent methyltransferase [Mycobacteriales bacterium]
MTAQQLRALLAAPGLLAAADPDDLRVAERLRAQWPADLVAAAAAQTDLRRRATGKFSRAERMLFTRAGLEQASSEPVARHRATRFATVDGTVLDLCCGIGGDLLALGGAGPRVVGADRDEAHALAARHNARQYGIDASVVVVDVRDLDVTGMAAVFVDPARRVARSGPPGADRRGGYSPGLDWCLQLPAPRLAVKAAPGIDRAAVPAGWEVEFVAVGRDLKEAVLWSPAWSTGSSRATVLLPSTGGEWTVHSRVPDPELPPAPVRPPGAFLLDPSPAITRAAAVADLAAALGAWQVDPQIAFLSADQLLRSPYGTSYAVLASLPFAVKPLRAELHRLDAGTVEIRRRGLAGDVDVLRRQLRGPGAQAVTVMLTRVVNRPWALVCRRVTDT